MSQRQDKQIDDVGESDRESSSTKRWSRSSCLVLALIVFVCWTLFHYVTLDPNGNVYHRVVNLAFQTLIYAGTIAFTLGHEPQSFQPKQFGIWHFRAVVIALFISDVIYDVVFHILLKGSFEAISLFRYLVLASPYLVFLALTLLLAANVIGAGARRLSKPINIALSAFAILLLVAVLSFSTAMSYASVFMRTGDDLTSGSSDLAHLKSVLIYFTAIATLLSSACVSLFRPTLFWLHFGLIVILGTSLVYHDEELTSRASQSWMIVVWEIGTMMLLIAASQLRKDGSSWVVSESIGTLEPQLSWYSALPVAGVALGAAIPGFRVLSYSDADTNVLAGTWSNETLALLLVSFITLQASQAFATGIRKEITSFTRAIDSRGKRIKKMGLFMTLAGAGREFEELISTSKASGGKLFISYSRKDASLADYFECLVCRSGHVPIRDDSDIVTGTRLDTSIEQLISISDIMVVLWSTNSSESSSVAKEIAFANEIGHVTVFIKLDSEVGDPPTDSLYVNGTTRNEMAVAVARVVDDHVSG